MTDKKNIICSICPGSIVNMKDEAGNSLLHLALIFDIAKLFVEHKANVNAQNLDGSTPLHVFAERKHFEHTKLLIDHDADVALKDNEGKTALHIAASHSRFMNMKLLLLKSNENVNARDKDGNTALLSAATSDPRRAVIARKCCHLLMTFGAEPLDFKTQPQKLISGFFFNVLTFKKPKLDVFWESIYIF